MALPGPTGQQRGREAIVSQVEAILHQRVALQDDAASSLADVELRTLVAIQIEVLLDIRDLLGRTQR